VLCLPPTSSCSRLQYDIACATQAHRSNIPRGARGSVSRGRRTSAFGGRRVRPTEPLRSARLELRRLDGGDAAFVQFLCRRAGHADPAPYPRADLDRGGARVLPDRARGRLPIRCRAPDRWRSDRARRRAPAYRVTRHRHDRILGPPRVLGSGLRYRARRPPGRICH